MKILLLSAYHASSHARWTQGLIDNLPHHDFELLTQPPRHFPWRSRGNSLAWAFDEQLANADADLIVATSMIDLAGLRGMVPRLCSIPTLVYFHENQFAYPTRPSSSGNKRANANILVTNLYTALAADRALFNSGYNRQSFMNRAQSFLDRMPDQIPSGVVERIAEKSSVLSVPLEDSLFDFYDHCCATEGSPEPDEPLRILWNHRWEYDKAPERFFEALFLLHDRYDFRLVVVGQQFRNAPPIFAEARRRLADHIDHWGWVEDRETYLSWLHRCDLVVSTAIHEFQGLAVQEATVLGCIPILPHRLAYPDFFEERFLYRSHLDSAGKDSTNLATKLQTYLEDPVRCRTLSTADLTSFRWSIMTDQYDREFHRLATEKSRE